MTQGEIRSETRKEHIQRIRRAISAARKFRAIGWNTTADAWTGVVKMSLGMYRAASYRTAKRDALRGRRRDCAARSLLTRTRYVICSLSQRRATPRRRMRR
jgi:hypothetical protein